MSNDSPGADCWVCGGECSPAAALAPLPFSRCDRCGFVFRPDGPAPGAYDEGEYEGDRGDEFLPSEAMLERRRDARVRLEWLTTHAPPPARLLDVGAASGAFVAEATAMGYSASGVEPSPAFARHAREQLGLDVATGVVEEVELAPGSFDVITLWHVLEHLSDPIPTLRRLAAALQPSGALALEVPNYGSRIATAMGRSWPALEPAVHVCQWDAGSLPQALSAAGFDVAELRSVTIWPYYPWRARLRPATLAHTAKWAAAARTLRQRHPEAHELLRAIARPSVTRAAAES